MTNRFAALVVVAGLGTVPAESQVYLITGSPNPLEPSGGYQTLLLHVDKGGKVIQDSELTSEDAGTQWIAVSNEVRKAVIVPRNPVHSPVKVIDLDSATVVKSCAVPSAGFAMDHWIWDVPGAAGPRYVAYVGNPGGENQ